ncbi:MAG: OmpH family outer membrane protein [Bacteroidota bacterium]|nr:OmpH family outer membrane protein [Bacteroidota bacterium]MDP4228804.1 OmpH family outer membrane protein [Bacteroidota bacterium]MDP4235605.1 OmpH family outer membrane protein [Bacteroidota bacterium]
MKRVFLLCFIVILYVGTTASYAQMRIAYIDATKILKRMPEAVDAESRLDQLVNQWNKDIGDMEADLKRKRDDYDRKRLIMTDAERSAVEMDVTDLKKRIDQFRQEKYGTGGELYKQQAELMKPAYDKLNKALEEVAVEGKYDFVFDRSSNDHSILYTNAKFDLSIPVAKKLGLETNDIFNVPLLNTPLNNNKSNPNQQQTPPPKVQQGQPIPPGSVPGSEGPIKH